MPAALEFAVCNVRRRWVQRYFFSARSSLLQSFYSVQGFHGFSYWIRSRRSFVASSDNRSSVAGSGSHSNDSSKGDPLPQTINPVSYPVKSLDSSSIEEHENPNPAVRAPREERESRRSAFKPLKAASDFAAEKERSSLSSEENESVKDRHEISPVSYPVRETLVSEYQVAAPEDAKAPRRTMETETPSWTREEIRYMKDAPSISSVSYPVRVAPLPEDRVAATAQEGKEEASKERMDSDELENERRRIEREIRVRKALKAEEDNAPFPTLIKVEKKKAKTVLDLQEAIREVKVHTVASKLG